MATVTAPVELPRRLPRQPVPDGWDGVWHPALPELACVADAVSLTMPHLEPYVIRTVGAAVGLLDEPLATRTRGYLDQETAHQRLHREFNRPILAASAGARRIDRVAGAAFGLLRRRGSPAFGVAVAAGAEAVAYLTSRWVGRHQRTLFRGAAPWATDLFLWHLAEEVEHKDVARAVYDRIDGSRRRYAAGLLTALAILALTAVVGSTWLLWDRRRLHHPVAWWRLTRWGFGYAFDLLPDLAATISRSHRPDDFVDPPWFGLYLLECPTSGAGPRRASGRAGRPQPEARPEPGVD